jgi:hypothetical protein
VSVEERLVEADGVREVPADASWRPPAALGPCCPAWLGSTGSGSGVGAMQLLGRSPGGRCLGGMLLSLAKLGHRGGQVEAGQQRGDGERAVAADIADQCEQPGGGAPLGSAAGVRRDTSVSRTGGPVIGVRRSPQLRVMQCPSGRMEDVSRRPGRIGGAHRVPAGAASNVLRGRGSLTSGVPVERFAFRSSPPGRARVPPGSVGSPGPRSSKLRRGQLRCQPSSSVPQRCPVLADVADKRDSVAGNLTRIDLAEPQPHQNARLTQPGEEPSLVPRVCRSIKDFVPEQAMCDLARDLPVQGLLGYRGPASAELRQCEIAGLGADICPRLIGG